MPIEVVYEEVNLITDPSSPIVNATIVDYVDGLIVPTSIDSLTDTPEVKSASSFMAVNRVGDLMEYVKPALNQGDGIDITSPQLIDSPTVSVDSTVVRTSRQIISGEGLSGGGDLASNRTIQVNTDRGLNIASDKVGVNTPLNSGLSAGVDLKVDIGNTSETTTANGSDVLLIEQPSGIKKRITRDNLFAGFGSGSELRGSVNPRSTDPTPITTLTVSGDPNNPNIMQGVAPTGPIPSGYTYVVLLDAADKSTGVTVRMGGTSGSATDYIVFDQDQLVWAGSGGVGAFVHLQTGDAVISVHGRQGVIVGDNGDYTASQIVNIPHDDITESNAQAAIDQVADNRVKKSGDTMTGPLISSRYGRFDGGIYVDGTGASNLAISSNNSFHNVSALSNTKKYCLWGDSSTYTIGMSDAYDYGAVTAHATTFTMGNPDQGWIFRRSTNPTGQAAMSLSGDGQMKVDSTVTAPLFVGSVTAPTVTAVSKLIVPVEGATAGVKAQFRYNDTEGFQGHNGTEWGSIGGGGVPDFEVIAASAISAEAKNAYSFDVTLRDCTVTAPTKKVNDWFVTGIYGDSSAGGNNMILTSTDKIMGSDEDFTLSTEYAYIYWSYLDDVLGWVIVNAVGESEAPQAIKTQVKNTFAIGTDTFSIDYDLGFVDVYINGYKLPETEFNAATGTNVVLNTPLSRESYVYIVAWNHLLESDVKASMVSTDSGDTVQTELNMVKAKADSIQDWIDKTHGIGSVVLRMDAINPSTLFGGTWALITGDASLSFGNGSNQSGTASGSNNPAVPVVQHRHGISHNHPAATTSSDTHNHTFTIVGDGGSGYADAGGSSNLGNATTSSDTHNHTFNVPNYSGYSAYTGSSGATLNVRGAQIDINVWKRTA